MKKSAIIGMVLATVMSFSAFGAVNNMSKPMGERVTGEVRTVVEELRGVKDKEGKVIRIITYESMSASAFAEYKGKLVAKISPDKATELRDWLEIGTRAEQNAKMELLEQIFGAKRAAESVPGNAEAKEIADAANAAITLLSLVKRAEDRGDDATLALADQATTVVNWKSAQRIKFTQVVTRQAELVSQGKPTRPALEQAYAEVKNMSLEAAKKAIEKMKELCKKGLV